MKTIKLTGIAFLMAMVAQFANAEVIAPFAEESAQESARLVIFRPKQVKRRGLAFKVFVDGKPLGKIRHNKQYALELPQGKHTITSSDHTGDKIVVNLLPNQTTVIKAQVSGRRPYLEMNEVDDGSSAAERASLGVAN